MVAKLGRTALATALTLSLAACGGGNNTDETGAADANSSNLLVDDANSIETIGDMNAADAGDLSSNPAAGAGAGVPSNGATGAGTGTAGTGDAGAGGTAGAGTSGATGTTGTGTGTSGTGATGGPTGG